MATRQLTGFNQAMHDLRSASRPTFTKGGKFDGQAIMRAAVHMAKFQLRNLKSWNVRMRLALREMWRRAKNEMAQIVAREAARLATPAPAPVARPTRTLGYRGFTRGSRLYSHGW